MDVKKRVRDESEDTESGIDSPEVKRLKEDLLDNLDDDSEFCTSTQDLDSFMKSFEDEITASPKPAAVDDGVKAVDLDLGYLLGASDDELGIPAPPVLGEENEFARVESEFGGEFWDGPGYDSFGLGLGGDSYGGEYEALDGFFEYSDLGFGFGDVSRRPETLPAQ